MKRNKYDWENDSEISGIIEMANGHIEHCPTGTNFVVIGVVVANTKDMEAALIPTAEVSLLDDGITRADLWKDAEYDSSMLKDASIKIDIPSL